MNNINATTVSASSVSGTIKNVTCYSNAAGGSTGPYGGIRSDQILGDTVSGVFVPSLTLQDSLLVNNTNHGFSVYTGSTGNKDTITYSALYGNTGTATSGRVTVGTGCLTTVSPTFYSTDSTSPYYLYLASNLPVIDQDRLQHGRVHGSVWRGAGAGHGRVIALGRRMRPLVRSTSTSRILGQGIGGGRCTAAAGNLRSEI